LECLLPILERDESDPELRARKRDLPGEKMGEGLLILVAMMSLMHSILASVTGAFDADEGLEVPVGGIGMSTAEAPLFAALAFITIFVGMTPCISLG